MKKALLLVCFAIVATQGLWAQEAKMRQQPAQQVYQLYERYKQNQTLSKEEYNALNPYLSELMQGDLSVQAAQSRSIGGGGTPQTNLVSTAYNFSQAIALTRPLQAAPSWTRDQALTTITTPPNPLASPSLMMERLTPRWA